MKKYLVTGINSGLGKYLYQKLPDCDGLDRTNFNDVKDREYGTIIHCAFNKENPPTDYTKYLDDNLFLTNRLKKIKHKTFVYISTVDVYQATPTLYASTKQIAESLLSPKDLILRCCMFFGDTMKTNHAIKLKNNEGYIGLSGESTFCYVLMDDLVEFFSNDNYWEYRGVFDFVSTDTITLNQVREHFNSSLELGDHIYSNDISNFTNPIFRVNTKYTNTAFENLKRYFK